MTPGNGNGPPAGVGGGPPPWAGPKGRVEESDDEVRVGPDARDQAKQRFADAETQQDRIEAKLDYLIAELEDQ